MVLTGLLDEVVDDVSDFPCGLAEQHSRFVWHNSHLYYEVGGSHFMVYPSSGAASGTHDQLGFVVEVVESMVATLRSNGVIFEEYEAPPGASATDGIMDFGGVKSAWFKDSEGNLLSIVELAGGSPFAARPESGVQSRRRLSRISARREVVKRQETPRAATGLWRRLWR